MAQKNSVKIKKVKKIATKIMVKGNAEIDIKIAF